MNIRNGRTQCTYSEAFKQMVVQFVENGTYSVLEVSRIYGIKGKMTVYKWIDHFGNNKKLHKVVRVEKPNEQERIKQLQEELEATKKALVNSQIELILSDSHLLVALTYLTEDEKKTVNSNLSPRRKLHLERMKSKLTCK